MKTVWVLGDQINREIASLKDAKPQTHRILFIRNDGYVASKRWHRQRLHLVLTAMRRFAQELRAEGFEVDERNAQSFKAGLAAHRQEFKPDRIIAMEPLNWTGRQTMEANDVDIVRTNQMLCHYDDFAKWAGSKMPLRMEDFYRWQRQRLDSLMDGNQPAGGAWNFDHDNRLPPPKQARGWYGVVTNELDDIDSEVVESLPDNAFGAGPTGIWATSRDMALERLDDFINNVLPEFGPYEDAMLTGEIRLAHSMLSHAINIGLLMPGEVVDAAEEAYRHGRVPIASAEGFIRQIIGWREYIWNIYWHWMPEYKDLNQLNAKEPLPAMFLGAETDMNCMSITVNGVNENAWSHHIQRLMVLGNFALIAGINPQAMVEWMHASYIDGADWVMGPNLIGMSLYADGGRMATKPYAAGGAYINRMSDYCKGCKYDPKKRVGENACPYTTLYWDFVDRNKPMLSKNHRMSQIVRNLERLSDIDEVRVRAREVKKMMRAGTL